MAAFEAVSKLNLRPVDAQSLLDVRSARLPDGRLPNDEFDPLLYREPRNPISTWMAYFNILRSLFGAGMLGMPLAISQAGMVLGPLLVIFTGCLIIHMHLTLLNCLNEISRQLHIPQVSYRYGFRMALLHGPPIFHCIGKRGPTIIAVFMLMSQLGICTVFVTFTSDSLRDIMDWQSNQPALLALLLPYLILEFSMKSLKIVSYVSLLGNFLNAVGLFLVFYHIFKDPHGELIRAANEALPLLFAFGTILFNLSAVGVVLSLDKALKDPRIMTKKFGVITIGISVTTIVSIVFGGLGYWSFGTMEENILRSLPFDDITSFVAIGLYMVAVALAYPIQCYPAIQIILEVVRNYSMDTTPSDATLKIIEWIARPLFVCLSFIVCYCVPYQAPFVAFVGNLCTTILVMVFPAIMELSLLYPGQYGKCHLYLIKNIIVIIIGMTSWVFGVVVSVYLIYVRLLSSHSPNDS